MDGWIKLHRKITDNWIWQEKPFDKRSAWIDMLIMANHDNNKFLFGGELVEVSRGSFITSELKLMERWGWSKTKVRNFLKILENDSMIIKKSDKKKTTIFIENYSDYQDKQTTEKPQKDHEETAERPQKDTNKNIRTKEHKNIKINNIYSIFDSYTENENLRNALKDFSEMRNKIKSPMTDRAATLLLSELDKLTVIDDMKIKILDQSIVNNWKSVYPLKNQNNQNNFNSNNKKQSSNPFLDMMYEEMQREGMN